MPHVVRDVASCNSSPSTGNALAPLVALVWQACPAEAHALQQRSSDQQGSSLSTSRRRRRIQPTKRDNFPAAAGARAHPITNHHLASPWSAESQGQHTQHPSIRRRPDRRFAHVCSSPPVQQASRLMATMQIPGPPLTDEKRARPKRSSQPSELTARASVSPRPSRRFSCGLQGAEALFAMAALPSGDASRANTGARTQHRATPGLRSSAPPCGSVHSDLARRLEQESAKTLQPQAAINRFCTQRSLQHRWKNSALYGHQHRSWPVAAADTQADIGVPTSVRPAPCRP